MQDKGQKTGSLLRFLRDDTAGSALNFLPNPLSTSPSACQKLKKVGSRE